ncbi:MAG: hypothetical protein IT452_09445 [Planctomycetia bacterium]|nr:hypothetical protein [Planctomycetia bacterium]
MATVSPPRHYRAYRPRPFTAAERKDVTILFGGLTWKHERLVQAALENQGYKALPLPNIERVDLDVGKELTDVGACCPTTFTTGSLARFLRDKAKEIGPEAVNRNYVYMTAGSCGPCRFGQYHESYTMALDGIGLKEFRLFLLDQTELDQGAAAGGGLEMNMAFSLGLVWGILCGDLITDLEYRTRPYEVVPGATDAAVKEAVERMYQAFRSRPNRGRKWGALAWTLFSRYYTNALKDVRRIFEKVEVDRLRVKPRVKITGEFWLQTHEGDGNYDIKRWLEREGAEVVPPPIAVWLDYLIGLALAELEEKAETDPKARKKVRIVKLLQKAYTWSYNRLRGALSGIPAELPDQKVLQELAQPYYHFRLNGGEGYMLVGKALYAHRNKHAHMICELSPYSCMPNTMSVGAMANVMGQHPDLLYSPIEIKGDAEVHALSRCQMVLTEAKKRAQREFDEAAARTGLTLEKARELESKRPGLRSAMAPFPHHGAAGTAANHLIELARRSR